MSQVSNAQNIAFSTAFATDKICGIYNGSFAAAAYDVHLGAGSFYLKKFSHNFGRPLFCDGIFSYDNVTFVTSGSQGNFTSDSNPFIVFSDSQYFYVYFLSLTLTETIYYRIVLTWIDNYDYSNPLVTPVLASSSQYKQFFNSNYNYQKLLISGNITATNPGAGNTGSLTIPHNLGYIPNYKLNYNCLPGQIWQPISGGAEDIFLYDFANQYELYDYADEQNLYLQFTGGSTSAALFTIYYRIYYDV